MPDRRREVWCRWPADDLRLYAVEELWEALEGYGWSKVQAVTDWPAEWIVVAHEGGGAFIADLGQAACPVSWLPHGRERWSPKRVAPSIEDFVAALTAFESAFVGEFGGDVFDETTGDERPEFAPRLAARLSQVLADADLPNFLSIFS